MKSLNVIISQYNTIGLLHDDDRLIVLGDFNLPSVSWMSDEENSGCFLPNSGNDSSIDFLNNMTTICPYQINAVSNQMNRFLDLVFVDDNSCYDLKRTFPIVTEDPYHPALEIIVETDYLPNNNSLKTCKTIVSKVYAFNKANVIELNRLIMNTDWDLIIPTIACNEKHLEEAIRSFYSTLYHYFDLTVPKIRPKSDHGPLWYNNNLKRLRNIKSNSYKKYKRSGRSVDYFKYIAARNHYNRCCKMAYSDHLFYAKQNVKNNPKFFWDFVNSKRKTWKNPSCMSFNGCRSDNDSDSCELFAAFFKSVYSTSKSDLSDYHIDNVGYDVSSPVIASELVESFSLSLKSSFRGGPDNVPSYILKSCASSLSIPICGLFNNSLKLGYFPLIWKVIPLWKFLYVIPLWKFLYVIPLWKSGSKTDIKNYRSISKLSAIPKFFE